MNDEIKLMGDRITVLEEGFKRHDKFLFGWFDKDRSLWVKGFAERLGDAVNDIGDIKKDISDFVQWCKQFGFKLALAILGFFFSTTAAVVWFIVKHADLIAKALVHP